MTASDPPSGSSRQKPAHMPATVKLNLKHRVLVHLREHGARNRDLLREDPEFSPYIGKALGETGKKRLDRVIRDVKAAKGRGARFVVKPLPLPDGLDKTADVVTARPTTVEALAAHAGPLVGHEELQNLLQNELPRLQRAIDDCFGVDGALLEPNLYVRLRREFRASVEASASLTQRFHEQIINARFIGALLNLVFRAFADEPERAQGLIAQIRDLVTDFGGLPATSGQPT